MAEPTRGRLAQSHEAYGDSGRLVLVGSVIVDLVMAVPSLPPRGGDLVAGRASFVVGGGYFVLAAARRAGMPAAFAGRHGNGPLGARVRSALDGVGVTTLLPRDEHGDTGLCVALVEPDGERTLVTSPGVEARLDSAALASLPIDVCDVVYLSGYDLAYEVSGPAIEAWLATRPHQPLVFDPGPLVADIPAVRLDAALARTALLTLNRREAETITAATDPTVAIAGLRPRLGPDAMIVVRDGARGAYLSVGARDTADTEVRQVPAPQVETVNTTGAGDVHTGTLVAAIWAGADPVAAVQRANSAAAAHVAGTPRPHATA